MANTRNLESVVLKQVPDLIVIDGTVFARSTDVASAFDKDHKDVLKAIRTMGCSADFARRNFAPCTYLAGNGREEPCYNLTRDGFMFLAMGFTGEKADRFKEAYIAAFNAMEAKLKKLNVPTTELDVLAGLVKALQGQSTAIHELKRANVDTKQDVSRLLRLVGANMDQSRTVESLRGALPHISDVRGRRAKKSPREWAELAIEWFDRNGDLSPGMYKTAYSLARKYGVLVLVADAEVSA